MVRYPAVIIAGGRATRMGGKDKGLLSFGGQTMMDRVIARLKPQVGQIALNVNGDPDRMRRFRLPILPDDMAGQPGPLAGVLAAMAWAADQGADRVVTVPADTPFFPTDLVQRLTEADGLVLAASQSDADPRPMLQPIFGVWPVALRANLRAALGRGETKVRLWAGQHGASEAVFHFAGVDPFFNINTPDDLRKAKALTRGDQCFRMK